MIKLREQEAMKRRLHLTPRGKSVTDRVGRIRRVDDTGLGLDFGR